MQFRWQNCVKSRTIIQCCSTRTQYSHSSTTRVPFSEYSHSYSHSNVQILALELLFLNSGYEILGTRTCTRACTYSYSKKRTRYKCCYLARPLKYKATKVKNIDPWTNMPYGFDNNNRTRPYVGPFTYTTHSLSVGIRNQWHVRDFTLWYSRMVKRFRPTWALPHCWSGSWIWKF